MHTILSSIGTLIEWAIFLGVIVMILLWVAGFNPTNRSEFNH